MLEALQEEAEANGVNVNERAKWHILSWFQPCQDCGDLTHDGFMVHDEVWDASGAGDGYICLDCLESRLGRPLVAADFKDVPLNDIESASDELKERLLRKAVGLLVTQQVQDRITGGWEPEWDQPFEDPTEHERVGRGL